ncbi:MAG: hypothetical protein AAF483_04365 [Planctomycetota bacterium]
MRLLSLLCSVYCLLLCGCGPEPAPFSVDSFKTLEQWAELNAVDLPAEAVELLEKLENAKPEHVNDTMKDQRRLLRRIRDWADPETVVYYGQATFSKDGHSHSYEHFSDGSVRYRDFELLLGSAIKDEKIQNEVRLDAGWKARKDDLDLRVKELFEKHAAEGYRLDSTQYSAEMKEIFQGQ